MTGPPGVGAKNNVVLVAFQPEKSNFKISALTNTDFQLLSQY